jgi:hypothetical protein
MLITLGYITKFIREKKKLMGTVPMGPEGGRFTKQNARRGRSSVHITALQPLQERAQIAASKVP